LESQISLSTIGAWAIAQNCCVQGSDRGYVRTASSLANASNDAVSFCNAKSDCVALVEECHARVIVCPAENYPEALLEDKMLILSDRPRLTFMRLVSTFFKESPAVAIHPTAIIHEKAEIGENVSIGAYSIIGASKIGRNSRIGEHVVIKDKVTIGEAVNIFPGVIIGADGFGYERNSDGEIEKFPHIGGVVIEDNVEIGGNTCVDRGTLDNTIIKRGAKIDNLVHVAHNVEIGEETLVIALSMLGGGAKIGKRSWVAPGSVISNKVKIGDDALAGLGAVIVKDVADKQVVMGAPARDQSEFRKMMKFINSNIRDE